MISEIYSRCEDIQEGGSHGGSHGTCCIRQSVEVYSKTSDKRETDRNFCEMLLKEVAQADRTLAMQLARELETKESTFTMELLLIKLEEIQRLTESLKI